MDSTQKATGTFSSLQSRLFDSFGTEQSEHLFGFFGWNCHICSG
jgi:hypothetical protein